jgi:hypothetical protein
MQADLELMALRLGGLRGVPPDAIRETVTVGRNEPAC